MGPGAGADGGPFAGAVDVEGLPGTSMPVSMDMDIETGTDDGAGSELWDDLQDASGTAVTPDAAGGLAPAEADMLRRSVRATTASIRPALTALQGLARFASGTASTGAAGGSAGGTGGVALQLLDAVVQLRQLSAAWAAGFHDAVQLARGTPMAHGVEHAEEADMRELLALVRANQLRWGARTGKHVLCLLCKACSA